MTKSRILAWYQTRKTPDFWPNSVIRHEHPGNPSSHYFFFTEAPGSPKKFVDPTATDEGDATIIELRGKGGRP
jgi:hypothetical protein